jgi:hypothetical protein
MKEGIKMIGRNKLTLNYEAMCKAMEFYLRRELFPSEPDHVVRSVREKGKVGLTVFEVEFEAKTALKAAEPKKR